ncbi:hypothetical protein EZS27_026072 [termite gut metagenome]|uniref:Uncharacterized protein n=1 Tax=termite gut metagenome TaxID=433724 RepID=A0A5J4QTR8_9ZZZZ
MFSLLQSSNIIKTVAKIEKILENIGFHTASFCIYV